MSIRFIPKSKQDAALFTFAAMLVLHLLAQSFDRDLIADVSQVLLMPPLALWLFLSTPAPRQRSTVFALGALFFSWLGDSAPRVLEQPVAFWSMVGFFLVGQLCYVRGLWPHRQLGLLAGRAGLVKGLLGLAAVALVGAFGVLGLPGATIVLYASAIIAMALLATGMGQAGVVGGVLFVISDSLIALRSFAQLELPMGGVVIMLTYGLAQLFLAAGFLGIEETARDVGVAPARAA